MPTNGPEVRAFVKRVNPIGRGSAAVEPIVVPCQCPVSLISGRATYWRTDFINAPSFTANHSS
jgi:hypothetical protein